MKGIAVAFALIITALYCWAFFDLFRGDAESSGLLFAMLRVLTKGAGKEASP